ncbi:hypothetical protein ACFWEH_36150 [Streptomyces anulatus]|uniref:hypothetical protein n=1 Tax=Streptomyces TaxID=1883 RepID=UPI00093B9A86|nr:hypothetical protein [Streptomyces sp. TSRI0395]OKI74032.1 hypothetical protein AMK12_37270 [Streptomyces sp. TSRI0395]
MTRSDGCLIRDPPHRRLGGRGRVAVTGSRTARTDSRRHGVGSPEALADGDTLQPLIDRCRHFGITTADLRRHGAQLPES